MNWYVVKQIKFKDGDIHQAEYACRDEAQAVEQVRRIYDDLC